MKAILRDARRDAGMTQKQIADKVKMSRTNYNLIETGRRIPQADTAIKIAKTLDTTVEAIWGKEV